MTVSASVRRADYIGNSATTEYSVTFQFYQVLVLVDGEQKTDGIDYTVTGGKGNTGTVTFATPPATGSKISIRGNETIEQDIDLVENDPFPADTVEGGLDRLTMIAGNLSSTLTNIIGDITAVEESAQTAADNAATSEANALASKNAAATSASSAAASLAALGDAETNAEASATAAAASETAAATSEANALASKNAAATSETNAAASASAASTSEANALASKNAAAASETAAATSEANAATSETNAAASATAAATSEANAAASASIANMLVITPFQFGGVGDGVADDAVALNAAFDAVRAQVATDAKSLSRAMLDLSGGVWRTTESINATGIIGWNWQVRGGVVVGECAGKAILDLCGSRGYELHGVSFWGDKTNMPACAWQAARTSTSGFCDSAVFSHCATAGYYSRAAIHEYGQETALHVHGTYFNYHHDARVAIFEGYDENGLASDFSAVLTGPVSHINNKVINCQFQYLPTGDNVATVTGVSNAPDGIITAAGHPFAVGDNVVFFEVGGMTSMRYVSATVTAVTTDTFTIDTDTTSFGAYTGGGFAFRKQTKATVYYSRGAGMNFADTYMVAWGQPQLEIGYPDATFLSYSELDWNILFEGAACPTNVLFTTNNQSVTVIGCRLKTYQADPVTSLLDVDSGTGTLALYHPEIECATPKHAFSLVSSTNKGRFSCFGARILWTGIANVDYANYGLFNGDITDVSTGLITYISPRLANKSDGSWTPTVTALTGSITTVGAKTCTVKYFNKWAFVTIDVTITTNGTGAGQVNITLPFTIGSSAVISGKEQAVNGKALSGICLSGLTAVAVTAADNTYPAADGARLILSGWIPVD